MRLDAERILLDPEDEHLRWAYVWQQDRDGYAYSARLRSAHKPSFLHRMILSPPPGEMVDHINGNTLDNRRSNLRAVDCRTNGQNRVKMPANNTSGFRGVWFNAKRQRWIAQAKKDGRVHRIGSFLLGWPRKRILQLRLGAKRICQGSRRTPLVTRRLRHNGTP